MVNFFFFFFCFSLLLYFLMVLLKFTYYLVYSFKGYGFMSCATINTVNLRTFSSPLPPQKITPCVLCLFTQSCPAHGLEPSRLVCPWDSPGKNTGLGCHFLLQGIFLTQEWNVSLQHWQVDSLPLSHQGSHIIITK